LFLSVPGSIAGIVTGFALKENSLAVWASISVIVFLLVAVFHKKWIFQNAEKYVEKPFSVYLSDN